MAGTFNFSSATLAGAIVMLAGLACDAVLLSRLSSTLRGRVTPKPWTETELAYVTAVVVGILLLVNIIYALIARLTGGSDLTALAPVIMPVELALRLLFLTGFVAFFRRQRIGLVPALGLDTVVPRKAVGWGTVFGFASLVPVGLLILASDAVCRLIGVNPSDQPVAELFTTTHSVSLLIVLSVFSIIVAPVFEEFFFRGFAYPVLKQRFGTTRALLVVSALFAVSHLHGPSFVPLFVLALGLGLAYEFTGSLLTSITMHALFNTVMVVKLLLDRGAR